MRTWLGNTIRLLCIAVLGACAHLPAPGSSRADVSAALGEPTERRTGVAGEEVWEYWAGYARRETFIVRFDGNGLVSTANQVLTVAMFDALPRRVATKDDVRDIVGRPLRRVTYPTGEVWEYRIYDVARRPTKMAVQFGHDGLLKEISQIQESFLRGISLGFH
jgi:outer membrane protein assembly factor BamE (lipoprotein component of BamABCDE complex)